MERLALSPALSPRRGSVVWLRSKESSIRGCPMADVIVSLSLGEKGRGERELIFNCIGAITKQAFSLAAVFFPADPFVLYSNP